MNNIVTVTNLDQVEDVSLDSTILEDVSITFLVNTYPLLTILDEACCKYGKKAAAAAAQANGEHGHLHGHHHHHHHHHTAFK